MDGVMRQRVVTLKPSSPPQLASSSCVKAAARRSLSALQSLNAGCTPSSNVSSPPGPEPARAANCNLVEGHSRNEVIRFGMNRKM